jgi:hypothetical protein
MNLAGTIWYLLVMFGFMMTIVLIGIIASNGIFGVFSPFYHFFKRKPKPAEPVRRELAPLEDGQRILTPSTKANQFVKDEEAPRARWTDSQAEEAWHKRNARWEAEARAQKRLERLRRPGRHSYRRKPQTRILLRRHFKELVPDEKGGKK